MAVVGEAGTLRDGALSWRTRPVGFHAEAPRAAGQMLRITYGGGRMLVVGPARLFLVGGKLRRADQLGPRLDRLVTPQGEPVALEELRQHQEAGVDRHLAFDVVSSDAFDGRMDDHLMEIGGVVCGDYLLQLYQGTAMMKPNMAVA
jgi:hypothetical protein